jgi:3-hydroxy-3-methylglutaryl-CoA-synthase
METQNPSTTVEDKPYGHCDPSRPALKLAHPPAGEPEQGGDKKDPTRQAGLHAIEAYVPRHAVKASTLEKAHGVDGKYTSGLMMHEFCGTGEDEDPVSICLTSLSRLMYRYNIKFEEVGMMYVGSESLLDRSKSIKSNLMMLFNEHNCFDVEGCDVYNACYGGTAALLNTMNWCTSTSWDGRWALACATDIADSPAGYRFMTGCACVSMLVGVDAALVFERERCTHIINRWDFYKPWGWHVMAPIVDGPGSIDVYYECLDGCQRGLMEKRGISNVIEDSDYCVFHLGSGPKFVKHAFERCQANAMGWQQLKGGRTKKYDGRLAMDETTTLFNQKVAPSLRIATRIGPQHTVATYTNLTSLMIHKGKKGGLLGKTINVFSYGSGAASTMYRLKVRRMPGFVKDLHEVLDQRSFVGAEKFDQIMNEYAETYARFDWSARIRNGPQPGGCYYLKGCDKYGRRSYYQVKDKEGVWKLPPPYTNEPPPRSTQEDIDRVKATLPEEYQNLAEFNHVSGVGEEWPPPPPREVTDEEMIELGLWEKPPEPPPPPPQAQPAPGDAAAALGGMDPNQLASLLQLLSQAQQQPQKQ